MTRQRRKISNSKVYHVIVKGIDDQDIFYDNQDRRYFLKQILNLKKEINYDVYSYCLMTNHIHMVIKSEAKVLSKIMQSLMIRYVYYFNSRYERSGTLVQNRFKSKCVENQKYFLEVCRYIHRNPEKAGMAKTQNYKWSSYQEYLGEEKIINKKVLLHYFNNDISEFVKYTTNLTVEDIENLYDYAEYEIRNRLLDEEVIQIIMKKFEIFDVKDVVIFFKNKNRKELEKALQVIKNIKGTNKSQVARILRINRKFVSDVWDRA
mgnify:FL=1